MSEELVRQLRSRYLDLLEKSIQNAIYGESRLEMALQNLLMRLRHPYQTRHGAVRWPVRAHSMIGQKRLRNLRELVERTICENVRGDYIETGVWRGGACILMRGVLAAYGVRDRRVFCADSFDGLPRPDADKYPADRRDRLFLFKTLSVSEESVRQNFAAYDLLDDQVVFVKGLFRHTLPALGSDRLALIRLDGDMYESTMDALVNLYDKVSEAGFIVVDDYGVLGSCRKAVHDFLDQRGLKVKMVPVDEACVWWQKN